MGVGLQKPFSLNEAAIYGLNLKAVLLKLVHLD